ncbi:unnamed protein product [Linum trigynum]|uniref:Uncharacterized protein n=1 Tax=Linum trigynum TaxID=586398 RepID=A0AAV2CEK9_9ROSI
MEESPHTSQTTLPRISPVQAPTPGTEAAAIRSTAAAIRSFLGIIICCCCDVGDTMAAPHGVSSASLGNCLLPLLTASSVGNGNGIASLPLYSRVLLSFEASDISEK